MRVVDGDIFESNAEIIVHQVNCKGVMGSGVAKQVKDKYPNVYLAYKKMCEKYSPSELLGTFITVPTTSDHSQHIVNIFAQDGYGSDKRHTDYTALRSCLEGIKLLYWYKTIAIPYRMSCDRGGGDWEIVSKMIEDELSGCDVTLYKYKK